MTKGLTQAETSNLIKAEIDKYAKTINALGCGSEVGCMAGKKHFQHHADKLESDINNLKTAQKENIEEHKMAASKMSEAATKLHDVARDFAQMTKDFLGLSKTIDDNKESANDKIDKVEKNLHWKDVQLWGIFSAVVIMCVAAVWSASSAKQVQKSVSSINSVDIKNQISTETFLAMGLELFTGKNIDVLLKEHAAKKILVDKEKPTEEK